MQLAIQGTPSDHRGAYLLHPHCAEQLRRHGPLPSAVQSTDRSLKKILEDWEHQGLLNLPACLSKSIHYLIMLNWIWKPHMKYGFWRFEHVVQHALKQIRSFSTAAFSGSWLHSKKLEGTAYTTDDQRKPGTRKLSILYVLGYQAFAFLLKKKVAGLEKSTSLASFQNSPPCMYMNIFVKRKHISSHANIYIYIHRNQFNNLFVSYDWTCTTHLYLKHSKTHWSMKSHIYRTSANQKI